MLVQIIQAVMMGILLPIAVAYVMRQGKRPAKRDVVSDDRIIRYGWPLHLSGWAMLLLSVMPAPVVITRHPESFPVLAIIFIACGCAFFAALSAYLVAETTWSRTILSDREIVSHSPWRLAPSIEWDDIVDVSYAPGWQVFRVTGRHGERIEVSPIACGAAEFVSEVRTRLRPEVYEKALRGFATHQL